MLPRLLAAWAKPNIRLTTPPAPFTHHASRITHHASRVSIPCNFRKLRSVFSVGGTHHMRYRTTPTALALAIAIAGIALTSQARAIDSNIKSYVCDKLDDFTATMSVVSVN